MPANPAEKKIASVVPSRLHQNGGNRDVVPFTRRKVTWRVNKRTGKTETRTQVVESPGVLARSASNALGREVSVGVFTLATLLSSEVGEGEDLAKVAVAHAALTYARKKGKSLGEVLTAGDGHYGSQQGRYAATRIPPTVRDIELAEAVLSGKISNPAPGAVQWDSPSAQDKLFADKEAGYETNADTLAQKRESEGKVVVYLPGVDQRYLRLWRKAA